MLKLTVIVGAVALLIAGSAAKECKEEIQNPLFNVFTIAGNVSIQGTSYSVGSSVFERYKPDELIRKYGYYAETHIVITEDGYSITLYRITGNNSHPNPARKKPVLLHHGILSSSMDFLLAGPKRSFAYILADLGFDVWLANARGSVYSRGHSTYNVDDKEYWNFSWHEMGYYDLPAEIDYILSRTNYEQIVYIGYSMGTTLYYVMLSERPEYNSKIAASYSLAPIAFFSNPSSFYKLFAQVVLALYDNLKDLGFYKIDSFNEKSQELASYFCDKHSKTADLCKTLLFLFNGFSKDQLDQDLLTLYFRYYPAGASLKEFIHYAQIISSGHFRKFDYGKKINKEKYNKVAPPEYNLHNVKVPTTLIYAANDAFTSMEDVAKLYSYFPTGCRLIRVAQDSFNHFDFIFGRDAKKLVYDTIIRLLLNKYY